MNTTRLSVASPPLRRRHVLCCGLLVALVMGSAHLAAAFEITVESIYLDPISLEVEATDTVLDVKELIELYESVPADGQILRFNAQVLDDVQTLDSYGIEDGSVLTLSIPAYDEEIRILQALIQTAQTLQRQINASGKSVRRAKTKAAFKRSKKRLSRQLKSLTTLVASAGAASPELAELGTVLDQLRRRFSRLRFRD